MANIKRIEPWFDSPARSGVRLSSTDVSDALRLLNLLLGRSSASPFAIPPDSADSDRIFQPDANRELKAIARWLLSKRLERSYLFSATMFSEPAWDILLALYGASDGSPPLTVTTVSEMIGCPMTTALRWLDYLEQGSLIERNPSHSDRRVVWLNISELGHEKMTSYLQGLDLLQR